MQPTIREGEAITVEPVEPSRLTRGDIILYRSDRGVLAHRIVGIKRRKGEETIFRVRGDAWGSSDESVESKRVAGKVVSVERDGYSLTLNSRGPNMWRTARGVCLGSNGGLDAITLAASSWPGCSWLWANQCRRWK